MIASYHTHTTFSDGRASVAAMVEAAAAAGVDEIGLSDHFFLQPGRPTPEWVMAPHDLKRYAETVLAAGGGNGSPRVRLGLEVDWLGEASAPLVEALGSQPFDYLIGSVHEVSGFVIDRSSEPWWGLDPEQVDELHRQYWKLITTLAESRLFDVVGHLDLPKKVGRASTVELDREVDEALDAIRDHGLVVELNTAGWHAPCGDAYPSEGLLGRCFARGIPVTLSADAHSPHHLTRSFDRGLERLAAVGYRELVRFAGRRRVLEPLASCRIP